MSSHFDDCRRPAARARQDELHLRVRHALGQALLQLANQPIIAQQVGAVLLSLQRLADHLLDECVES